MSELKNCPFCGGEVEIKQEKAYGYWIGCLSCSIETSYMNKAEAIAAWNTRQPRFTEVEREAIEDALIPMKIMLQSEKINFPNFHRERIEKYEKNIATVRQMLAEGEGEK